MNPFRLLRRLLFLIEYHLYAKPKLSKTNAIKLLGVSVSIPPTVFHPQLFFSSKILCEYLSTLELKGKDVLDMGCGSGVISLLAASMGACVVAIDINPVAVTTTADNSRRNHLEQSVRAYQGNLFEPITLDESFDYIFF